MTSSELEKKQREFMEQAMQMAKKSTVTEEPTYIPQEETAKPTEEQEIMAIDEEPATLADEEPELAPKEEKNFFGEEAAEPAPEEDTATSYGVFDAEELTGAIESGELTGEGLRQAAEILAEMTSKTEFMKKLLEEQEEKNSKSAQNGEDYGLNSFINRHNNQEQGNGNNSAF